MIFVFAFVYVMYYVYSFVNIVPSSHPWDESYLIMVYDLLNVLLDLDYQCFFLRILPSMLSEILACSFAIVVMSLRGFGIRIKPAL